MDKHQNKLVIKQLRNKEQIIKLSQMHNKQIFWRLLSLASVAALDFVADQSVAEGGEYP